MHQSLTNLTLMPINSTAAQTYELNTILNKQLSQFGHHPLLRLAAPLIVWLLQIRNYDLPSDIQALRQTLINEVTLFNQTVQQLNIAPEQADSLRYILCASIDEFILNKQLKEENTWQSVNDWSRQCLINTFFSETWGGENFFNRLDKLLTQPKLNKPLIELALLSINLGYTGKYRMENQGAEKLRLLREQLFWVLKQEALICDWQLTSSTTEELTDLKRLVMPAKSKLGLLIGCLSFLIIAVWGFSNAQLNLITQTITGTTF